MSGNRFGRFYDSLAPRERVSAINAAAVRGDEAERQRLVSSAPLVRFDVVEYHGVSVGLREVTDGYVIVMLETLATFWRGEAGQNEAWDDDEAERWHQLTEYAAYRLRVLREAWRQFCAELQVAPDAGVACRSGLLTHLDSMPNSEETAAQIRVLCPAIFSDAESQPLTVEDVLESYWLLFAHQERQWM